MHKKKNMAIHLLLKDNKPEKKKQIWHVFWFIAVMNIVMLFLALIIGNVTGFVLSLKGHLWLALVMNALLMLVAGVFVFLSYLWNYLEKNRR
jgi:ABC-type protease/lipase transport system fused ATPase/permease subunit